MSMDWSAAAAWTEPLATAPTWEDARYDEKYIRVRDEISKLEGVTDALPQWDEVESLCSSLLQKTAKDILLGCYLGAAGMERTGVSALPRAVALLGGLIDGFGQELFPPRPRARRSALEWWVGHCERFVSQVEPSAEHREALEQASNLLEGLTASSVSWLGDDAPTLRPLKDALTRALLALPAAPTSADASGGPAASEPATASAEPTESPAPEDTATAAAPTETSPAEGALRTTGAPASAEAEPAAVEDSAAVEDAATSATEAVSPLRCERSAALLEPIREDAPGGGEAKHAPLYLEVSDEISKLERPSDGVPKWENVAEKSVALLTNETKDFRIASYLAAAWLELEGLPGLTVGLRVLHGLCEDFWDVAQPPSRRLRRRANIFTWLFDRTSAHLANVDGGQLKREQVAALRDVAQALSARIPEKFDGEAPGTRPLLEAIERQWLAVAESKPAAPTEPAQSAAPAKPAGPSESADPTAAAPRAAAAPASAPAPTVEGVPAQAGALPQLQDASDAQEVRAHLRKLAKLLKDAGKVLQKADAADPRGYRLTRMGAWLSLNETPAAQRNGNTLAKAPSKAVLTEIEAAASHQKWETLLKAAEGALLAEPLWLGANGYVVQALNGLGERHQDAAQAVSVATQALLDRLPGLAQARFSNGRALIDAAESQLLGVKAASPQANGGGAGTGAVALAEELKAKLRGKDIQAALEEAAVVASQQGSARSCFVFRLEVAEQCLVHGHAQLAAASFEGLLEDVERHDLEAWEPSLAARVFAGMIAAGGKAYAPRPADHPKWHRVRASLARISPSQLLKAQP